MTIADWFLPSMLAAALWGVSMFLPKLAVKALPPLHLVFYATFFWLLASIVMMAFYGFELEYDAWGIFIAVAVGVIGTVAQLLYTFAISRHAMTYAIVITSLYPAVATGLAYFILDETVSLRQAAGILLGICAIVLMVGAHDDQEA